MLENLSSSVSADPIEKTKYEIKILEDLILSREDEIIDLIEEVLLLIIINKKIAYSLERSDYERSNNFNSFLRIIFKKNQLFISRLGKNEKHQRNFKLFIERNSCL